eukprot:GEZU01008454.1.p2 GENE.GEZU01008454.1~~GEZU01008454.1.p2  ORF type:complete len:125 (+),score=10.13 GEZU01008454.1:361-735(+)
MIRNAGSKEVAIGDLKFGVGAPGSGRGDGTGNGNDAAAVVTEEDAEEQRRRGQLTFNNEQYNAKLVDLPCIVEAYKSLDRHQYFKAGDIGQKLHRFIEFNPCFFYTSIFNLPTTATLPTTTTCR